MYSFTLVVLLVWKFALSKEDFLSYFLTRSNLWESPRQSRGFTSINYVGSGCRERDNRGVSAFGAELIERMNAVGMLIDTSHASMATMADAIKLSKQPIIISHTCCESVHHHVRNTTDKNLKLLADRGGVVGICQIRVFLTAETTDNLDAYFDHIDHAIDVAGIDSRVYRKRFVTTASSKTTRKKSVSSRRKRERSSSPSSGRSTSTS